jgi:hypothetical protein
VQQGIVGAGSAVILSAEQAGHGDLRVIAVLLDDQLGLSAGARQHIFARRQLEFRSLHHDCLSADRANISNGSFHFRHSKRLQI